MTTLSHNLNLRLADRFCLPLPMTRTYQMEDRAFCATAPHLWNALPKELRAAQLTGVFKKGP